jgi:hypothetical protein
MGSTKYHIYKLCNVLHLKIYFFWDFHSSRSGRVSMKTKQVQPALLGDLRV